FPPLRPAQPPARVLVRSTQRAGGWPVLPSTRQTDGGASGHDRRFGGGLPDFRALSCPNSDHGLPWQPRHASSGWGAAPLVLQGWIDGGVVGKQCHIALLLGRQCHVASLRTTPSSPFTPDPSLEY